MRKWLYCILLTAMVLPMVSCRRAVEKARRNIRLEAEQMRTLVEQMLTLARADNGVRPAAMEPVNLSLIHI